MTIYITYRGGTPMKMSKFVILLMLVSLVFVSTASADDLEDINQRFTDLGNDDDRMKVMNIMMAQQDVDVVKIDIITTETTTLSSFFNKFKKGSSNGIHVTNANVPTTYYIIKSGLKATITTTVPNSNTYENMWIVEATIDETERILGVLEMICGKEAITKTMMKDCLLLYRSVELTNVPGIKTIVLNFIVN